jgi:23S rRNA (uracil1939-C5)-methyltransferase
LKAVGRKKNLPLIENLEILDITSEGQSIGKVDNMIVFVPGLIPGDIVNVQIKRKRRNYMEGFVTELKTKSTLRIEPFCSHFGVCGGCKWQNLPYAQQLFYKQKQVTDNLQRIGKVELPEVFPIIGSRDQRFYRNKLEFTFSETRWLSESELKAGEEIADRRALGFHIPGKFDRILEIEKCYLQDDLSNKIRNEVRDFTRKNNYTYYHQRENSGLMRNLIIRNTLIGEWMVIVVFQFDEKEKIDLLLNHIVTQFPFITSLIWVINSKKNDTLFDLEHNLFSGRDHIFEELDGIRFKIGPKSFFQTNSAQAHELYRKTLEFAALKGDEIVYDLYTGAGTIANYIARKCKQVVGIEFVKEAIIDAGINSQLNEINNTSFFAGDIKDTLNPEFFAHHGKPDIIITDPPRAGMHPKVIQQLIESLPDRIVYVSCNPATQARDINLLSEYYKVTAIQPVDMFPQTHHVENVVRLEKI